MAGNERNCERDRSVTRTLQQAGWRVVRIWEHHLRSPERLIGSVSKLLMGR
jgi:G:T-mismatch repair DNA endonuclease (very short patch repair protein)